MKKYLLVFRIRLINNIQYRMVTFGAIASNIVWVLLELMIYMALYNSAGHVLPMTFSQIVSYVWVKRIVMNMLAVVAYDGETSTLITCIPVLLIAIILPEPYRLQFPMSVLQVFAFIVSVILALGLVVAFAMIMFITLFYTIAQRGIKIIVTAVSSFLSGGMIPITFFPEKVFAVVKYLPFSSMQSTPLLIYSGNITGTEILKGIAMQILWMLILILIGKVLMNHSIKHVVVQGG